MKFSVVLIARNEEKTLPRLLGSLKNFMESGGEVVVVDTGSSDNTVGVAFMAGCRVYSVGNQYQRVITAKEASAMNKQFVFKGEKAIFKAGDRLFDYAAARNYAATQASNDMVAMPDCDEAYSALDFEKLNNLIEHGAQQFEYNFVFSHDQYGNEAVKFRHSKFYDRRALKWVGIVHEVLTGVEDGTNVDVRVLGEDVIKLEHYQNQETNRSGYLLGLALDCYLNPENDRNSHYLGRELLWKGRPKSAIKELARHVEMKKWPAERAQSLIFIGDAYALLNDEEHAVMHWERAHNLFPGRREAALRLAAFYQVKDKAAEAKTWSEIALSIPDGGFYADNQSHYREWPHEILYWAEWRLWNKEKSKEHWQKCIEMVPNHPKYLHDARFYTELPQVSFILPTLGRPEGLKKAIDSIEQLNYPMELVEIVVDPREEQTVPEKVRDMLTKTKGSHYVFASNDIEFEPDSLIQAVLTSKKEAKGLVALNTGPVAPDEGNICEHFLISQELVSKLGGEIFDTEFHHVGVDNLLWAKAKKEGQATRAEGARVKHNHFSKGAEFDHVYQRGWANAEKDRALLKAKLAAL